MEVIKLTSRKRETYCVHFKYSVLWECALGIAAITNNSLLNTLEKPIEFWNNTRSILSTELLDQLKYVEINNTWKALLQLLHINDFNELDEFTTFIKELSHNDLKFYCLPFIGEAYQNIRKNTALGKKDDMKKMQELTETNEFFPKYIEFICNVDTCQLKNHLISVMKGWYTEVVEKNVEDTKRILQADYNVKKRMKEKMSPEELVEWSTSGIKYVPEPSVKHVLLIPQYIYRPWNIEADIEETKVFYYSVASDSISPNDKYTPDYLLVLKHKALGDEIRLKIVKLLFEEDRSLQDITAQLNIGKSTIHHHLKILRAAKLVEIIDSKYSMRSQAVELLPKELHLFLNK